MNMIRWWKDLSVAKKLYAVVGVMALLIASELLTLLFVMNILSSVRSFVGGEGLWSKAQKDAVHNLHQFAFTRDQSYFQAFEKNLSIPLGDRKARLAMENPAGPNEQMAFEGFLQGGNHPEDIPGLINLILRFHRISYINRALTVWRKADFMMEDLVKESYVLKVAVDAGNVPEIRDSLRKIGEMNERLTVLEVQFSNILGEGSRWLEDLLMMILVLLVLTVESCGLYLTISFTRNLSRNLEELSTAANEVGQGNFSHLAPVHSRDELGQLAEAINRMTLDLKNSIGERDQAENASRVKSLFLANMSHEIRTPLGVIIGLAEIAKDPNLDGGDRAKYIETIERTGKNLNRIINDILDISKVEAGFLEVEKTEFTLSEFMTEIHSMLAVHAERNNNQIDLKPLGVLPRIVYTDRTRLRQILVNLVNNALKFTKDGKVTMYYTADESHLFFDVADTGIGIAGEFKKDLFKNFSQADASPSRQHEGTGLGLALSRRLAQALGGDVILLRSEIGVGTTFRVSIANPPPPTMGADAVVADKEVNFQSFRGKRILVVEDVKENQLILRLFLARHGIHVEFADNGHDAVVATDKQSYDAILMDMQMPVMDGYTATLLLRERGFKKPIIALTAHAMKEDRERCLSAGCDEYLTKPIDAGALYETLAKFFEMDTKSTASS